MPGVLEALPELTKWVRKGPKWGPEHLACPLCHTYIFKLLAAVPGGPELMAGGIVT